MRTIADLSTLEMRQPAPGHGEPRSQTVNVPSEPEGPAHAVAPGVIGIAIAWLAFFALVIEQALATNYGEALRNVVMHLH